MFLCVCVIVFSLPKGRKFKYEFDKGKPWMHEQLIAPFDFAIEKSKQEIETEKREITSQLPAFYEFNDEVEKNSLVLFRGEMYSLWLAKYGSIDKPNYKKNILFGENVLLSLYNRGVVSILNSAAKSDQNDLIYIVRNNEARPTSIGVLLNYKQATKQIHENIKKANSDLDTTILSAALQQALTENILYNENLNQKISKEKLINISNYRGMVRSGELIVDRGRMVDQQIYNVLESLKNEYDRRLGILGNKYIVSLGQGILVGLILTLLMVFLSLFRKDIYADLRKMFIILLIVTFMLVVLSWALRMNLPSLYFIPYCIVPIIIRVIFDTRLALYIHLLVVVVAGFFVPNGYEFIFLQITAGMVAINSIKNLLKRSQFLLSALLIYATYIVGYIGISIIHEGSFLNIDWSHLVWFLVSVILSLIAYPLIYAFEKLFGITTEVTLMEYTNINNPLLRELSYKAPGTFQHSLQVANLAEAAMFEIGGNALLVRAGALYHDIGKMESPQYFIENQQQGSNPHDDLPYEESAKIIIRHVYAGIEIATRNQLPKDIIDFIRTHHGNSRVDYFYQSFLKNYPEASVNENVFRYPGPIPFSKETAVLMLADSVEAASRSLKLHDAKTISEIVERVIDYKIQQKQLINSDISIKEIHRIKQLFKEMLMSIYHVRIEY
ncbi:MAG: HDIG domain-containing protein [Sphingobacteriales bacterium]|nr:HDIG domain-containing protein [Sphingobacteriales bacterium]